MTLELSWLTGVICLLTGTVAVMLSPRSLASWCLFLGMVLLAAEARLDFLAFSTPIGPAGENSWIRAMVVKSVLVTVWLGFSLVYARGNWDGFLRRWKWALVASFLIPLGILTIFHGNILEPAKDEFGAEIRFLPSGNAWLIVMLLITLAILANFEKTYRSAVGINRWRVKYLFIGVAVIFGVKVYSMSQVVLFAARTQSTSRIYMLAVIIGCVLIAIGQFRFSLGKVEIYPSRAVLQRSLTAVLASVYFLIVALLAPTFGSIGGEENFPTQAQLMLFGLVCLTVLLLSERFHTRLQRFVSRHFKRAEHDYRKIWTEFSKRTSSVLDAQTLAANAAEVISKNFHVLSVTVLQAEPDPQQFKVLVPKGKGNSAPPLKLEPEWLSDLATTGHPVNLEKEIRPWANVLRKSCPRSFGDGGDRLVIPLVAAENLAGLVVLADRVNGTLYSHEELDLLSCIGDQLGAALLNCSLMDKVSAAKELEAFQTLSTFFVHDLKNAASSLSLTLQNLPVHFDDPEFRVDAGRAVGRTVERINQMIQKLGSLRHELQLRREPCRLDLLCAEVLDGLDNEMTGQMPLQRDLQELPVARLDREAMRSVMTNLVANAREAIQGTGSVSVTTRLKDGQLSLTVSDTGCGMSPHFIKDRLFRPFSSTKTKGLGIGMFQCKTIIEAHQGSILVTSEPGFGTSFTILLPAVPSPAADLIPS